MPKWIVAVIAVLAIAGGGFYFTRSDTTHDAGEKKPPAPIPVTIVTAATKDTPIYVGGIGNVIALNQVVVRSRIDGELVSVNFTEGQRVKQGDLLAQIDDRAIRAELERAVADKASNQARLMNAQLNLKRYNNLLRDDAIAKQIVDQETANVRQLQAAVDISQAAVSTAQVQLSFTRITAPLSGYVGIRTIDAGNVVRAADANGLVTITQTTPIAILFALPQTALNDVLPLMAHKDRPVEIFAKEDGKNLATGQLQAIDNQIDPTTGTLRLKAVSPNDPQTLWPGQFVMVRVKTDVLHDRIVLPLVALQRSNDATFVYRIATDDKAEQVDVKILHEDKDSAVVDTIKAGDRIVIDGQSRLKPGSAVTLTPAPNDGVAPDQTADR